MTQKLAGNLKEAQALSRDEQMLLIAHLARHNRDTADRPGKSWAEVRGAAPGLLEGEDAQSWVSRSRREDQRKRDRS